MAEGIHPVSGPRVSVVIPAYNVSAYIRQAVDSALGQTVADLEVIVIDDGSSDATIEQLAGISDPRLRVFRRRHAGVSISRNLAIRLARASNIGFLDGDDIWLPTKTEKQLKILETRPQIDLTFSFSRTIDSSGRDYGLPLPRSAATVSFRSLLRENPIRTASSVLVRREALLRAGPFDPKLSGCEDHDMWLRIARRRPNNFCCLPEVLTLYRRRSNQLTANWRALEISWVRMFDKTRICANREVRDAEAQARSRIYSYFAAIAYEYRNFPEALRLLGSAVRFQPSTGLGGARNWILAIACLSGVLLPPRLHRFLESACLGLAKAAFSRFAAE